MSRRAERFYEGFHWGRRPSRRRQLVGPPGVPAETVDLGRLVDLVVRIKAPKGTRLACDAKGERLYLLGPTPVAFEARGVIEAICYATDKNDGPFLYEHEFEGTLPQLAAQGGHAVIKRNGSRYVVTDRGIEH